MKREKELGVDKEREVYNKILSELTSDEIDDFIEEGTIPKDILKIVDLNPATMEFVSKRYNDIVIGTIYDISDMLDIISDKNFDEMSE
jgi:hypothetical protein